MQDPFEESLRNMLRSSEGEHDDARTLNRVLRTANRQVGAGDLFSLIGHWFRAIMLAIDSASDNLSPVSKKNTSQRSSDKVD